MKFVKNTGKKIVHVGKKTVMPGAEIKVADSVVAAPAIQVLANRGVLSITEAAEDKVTESAGTAATSAVSIEVTVDTAAEKTSAKKTSSKKTSTETATTDTAAE